MRILNWALRNKILFLSLPTAIIIMGVMIMKNTGKEFMPSLNEGSFLLMPTSMPHSGVAENKRVLQQLDMAVASIPEIKTVVGKAGRTESALDPAPLSMYENMIQYKPEYLLSKNGERQRYKVNDEGFFVHKDGSLDALGHFRQFIHIFGMHRRRMSIAMLQVAGHIYTFIHILDSNNGQDGHHQLFHGQQMIPGNLHDEAAGFPGDLDPRGGSDIVDILAHKFSA